MRSAKISRRAGRSSQNLIDEEAGNPNHPELWLQFAEQLGASADEVRATEKQPETAALIDTFRSVCSNGATAEGLAALYAYESQIPAVSESKIDGLKKHYGFDDREGLRVFQRPRGSRSRARRGRARDAASST